MGETPTDFKVHYCSAKVLPLNGRVGVQLSLTTWSVCRSQSRNCTVFEGSIAQVEDRKCKVNGSIILPFALALTMIFSFAEGSQPYSFTLYNLLGNVYRSCSGAIFALGSIA